MGKFTNTRLGKTINTLEEAQVKLIKDNRFYTFTNLGPTTVTFYNINKEQTSLDYATENINSQINNVSGLRFDKINDALLYGVPKMDADLDIGDFGTESSPITGDASIPPNTFHPYPESYFTIEYFETKKKLFFRVTGVNIDTLPNGANFYKITYVLDNFDLDIDAQVVREFNLIYDNIGSDTKCVVESSQYKILSHLEDIADDLRGFYKDMFFKQNIQTFVYRYGEWGAYFYDAFCIEFMIRTQVLYNGIDKYTYVSHACTLPPSFNIDYKQSFFNKLESCDPTINMKTQYAVLVTDPMSLLSTRLEGYYMPTYRDLNTGRSIFGVVAEPVDTIDNEMINMIKNKQRILDPANPKAYYNIIYNYFYDEFNPKLADCIYDINFVECKELYYSIPMLIFIIEKYISTIMQNDKIDVL